MFLLEFCGPKRTWRENPNLEIEIVYTHIPSLRQRLQAPRRHRRPSGLRWAATAPDDAPRGDWLDAIPRGDRRWTVCRATRINENGTSRKNPEGPILYPLVDLRRFELLTPSMRTRCATRLRHRPFNESEIYHMARLVQKPVSGR
jgi:hypothetical protein